MLLYTPDWERIHIHAAWGVAWTLPLHLPNATVKSRKNLALVSSDKGTSQFNNEINRTKVKIVKNLIHVLHLNYGNQTVRCD